MDCASSVSALRAFNGNANTSLHILKAKGKKFLAVGKRPAWFSWSSDLNSVCKVATPTLKHIYFWDLQAKWGVQHLQKRVLHYTNKHSPTPAMVAFLKAADEFLQPEPGMISRIIQAVASLWPFGMTHLNSQDTVFYQRQQVASPHAPSTGTKCHGRASVSDLPSFANLRSSIFPNKVSMMEKILAGKPDEGELEWRQFQSPAAETLLNVVADVGRTPMQVHSHQRGYDYAQSSDAFTCTVNFADHTLFGYWQTQLFAQDEIQVVEHPDLGRLQQYLKGWSPFAARAESYTGIPTPWLIKGVKRHGRVHGLYGGHNLSKLSGYQAKQHIYRSPHPEKSNILAMAAIAQSPGRKGSVYSSADILQQFLTAYTAFKGAKEEAQRLGKPLTIQTGNWGAGAFGNDHALMAVIQILAARYAGVDRLDYYTFDRTGQCAYNRASQFIEALDRLRDGGGTPTLGSILKVVYQADFKVGLSNGT